MKKYNINWIVSLATFFLVSCGGSSESKKSLVEGASGSVEVYESKPVHAIQQALPQIMIIPK